MTNTYNNSSNDFPLLWISVILGMSLILLFGLIGCKKKLSVQEAKQMMIGEYELYIGPNQNITESGILSSKLVLYNNETYMQTCFYKNKGPYESKNNTWSYDHQDNTIYLSKFRDCAGVWPQEIRSKGDTGAHLVVKGGNSPIILIHPDVNVFYQKEK